MAKQRFNMEELCVSFTARNRYYAVLLSKINKVPAPIPTAGIGFSEQGKIVMYYNEQFFLNMNLAEGQELIEHELLHIILQHPTRLPKDKDDATGLNDLKNMACDMAINQYLPNLPKEVKDDDGKILCGGGIYPETYNLPKDMFAEWYLEELKKQAKNQPKGKGGGKGDGNYEGQDNHTLWGKTIDDKGNVTDVAESDTCDIEHELEKIVRQAAKECEGDPCMGKLPLNVQKELAALSNPKKRYDWKRELKVFVNTVLTLSKRLSQKRVNRRFLETVDYILPGKKKDRRPKILLARDTSGSVFNDEMQLQFLNEMINISKFCEVFVADCDTEVHQIYTVKKTDDFKKYEGGGGTAFEPIFVEAKRLSVDGIIYLTDTEGSFPKKEDIGKFSSKTIWVTINQEKVNVPFGKHVNIPVE